MARPLSSLLNVDVAVVVSWRRVMAAPVAGQLIMTDFAEGNARVLLGVISWMR